MPEVIGIQFIRGGMVHYYYPAKNQDPLKLYDHCVVETEHGLQLAKVVHPVKTMSGNGLPEKMYPILRAATAKDKEQFETNQQKEHEAYKLCRHLAIEKKLAMKLVDVSYALDARKAVFYFTAENRVDFRELVKDLAHALKLKIEMRQIGVRDEARRLGGVGCCGRHLCCCTFLKDFVSVSIRMAKEQNLSLNPSKVSGLCGRLMCCLSYEYEGKGKPKVKPCAAKELPAELSDALAPIPEEPAAPQPANPPVVKAEAAPAPTPAASANIPDSKRHKRRPHNKNRRKHKANSHGQERRSTGAPEGR